MATVDDAEDECRVCRGGAEFPERPLFHPCLCKGSIGQVHQSCLEEWLAHSNKNVCELCHAKYQFVPYYSPDMPQQIPMKVIIMTVIQHILPSLLNFVFRVSLTLFMWLFVMPLCTCWLYRIWLPRYNLFTSNNSHAAKDIVSGLTISAVIALSFIVMMSFTDFLRNHWDLGNRRPRRNRVRRRQPEGVVAVQQQPLGQIQPQMQPQQLQPGVPALMNRAEGGAHEQDHDFFDIVLREEVRMGDPLPPRVLPIAGGAGGAQQIHNHNNNHNNHAAEEEDFPAPVNAAAAVAEEEAMLDAIQLEDEQDMHFALDELIGLRGPWHVAFRNVMWLLLFNAIYIGMFAFVPYNIGLSAKVACTYYFDTSIQYVISNFIPPQVVIYVLDFIKLSNESKNDLQLPTILTIGLGFGLTAFVAFVAGGILSHMHSTIPRVFINHYVTAFNEVTMIIKVGLLLFHRIFVLPIALGLALLYCLKGFVEYPAGTWIEFVANNIVGFLALSWAMGISFMLTVTLTVLQLREVLHPDILAKVIRPQEAHSDLLKSLKYESTLTHARRTFVSMLVYLIILFLFVYIPIQACRTLGGSFFPVHIKVWYFLPEIQLPVELSVGHIIFLTILERKKDMIGKLEHAWFQYACGILGISRFILPYAPVTTTEPSADGGEESRGVVLQLMARPAANWDAHNGDANVSRWAWSEEAVGELEASVVPREVPRHWLAKSVLLAVVFWMHLVCLELAMLFLPTFLGRFVCYALQVPHFLLHDPICYAIGAGGIVGIYTLLHYARKRGLFRKIMKTIYAIPMGVLFTVCRMTACHIGSCVSVGCMLTMIKLTAESSLAGVTIKCVLRDVLFGIAIVHNVLFLVLHSSIQATLARFNITNPLSDWADLVRNALVVIYHSYIAGDWSTLHDALLLLDSQVVAPLFAHSHIAVLFPCVAYIFAYMLHMLLFHLTGSSHYAMELLVVKLTGSLAVGAVVSWGGLILAVPLKAIGSHIYNLVRDQRYLVGKKLQNIEVTAQ